MYKRNLLLSCTLTFALGACGDGGGNTTAAPPTPQTTLLQGLWQSQNSSASTTAAVVLPDGRMWMALTDTSVTPATTRLVKTTLSGLSGSFTGNAKRYSFVTTSDVPVTATVTANVVEKSSLSGMIRSGGTNEAYTLGYLSRYDTAAELSEFTGVWSATLGSGVVSWTISATGALSGTRTTGCTYAGQLSLRAERKAVVEAAIAETCAGSVTQLSGVGALTSDKSRMSLFMTSSDESRAVVVSLGR